jgi:hypothetical protein
VERELIVTGIGGQASLGEVHALGELKAPG